MSYSRINYDSVVRLLCDLFGYSVRFARCVMRTIVHGDGHAIAIGNGQHVTIDWFNRWVIC